MTTSGSVVSTVTITDQFEGIRDTYNTGIVWSSTSNPFRATITGRTLYWDNYGGTNPASGPAAGFATGDLAPAITDVNVTASTIITQFRAYAVSLSRIRSSRLRRFYNTNGNLAAFYDTTAIASLATGYSVTMNDITSATVIKDEIIDASNLDAFVSALSTKINTNRTTTLDFQERYCHSSCHGSCHGSI